MSDESNGTQVFVTGRIVYVGGDLFKGAPMFDDNRQPIIDQRTGNQKVQYGFGLAVPKADLQDATKGAIYQAIYSEAYKIYPSRQLPPDFAFKFKDGDGIDHLGQPFNQRTGYAGCLVFALFTHLPIQYVRFDSQLGRNVQITDGIKCGDWVTACVQVKAHPPKGRGKAGVYLNPTFVQFVGWGEEIINRPSADSVFGTQAPAVPQGASATPILGANAQAAMQGQAVQPAAPHFGVLPQQFQQPQTPPVAPAAAPQYVQPSVPQQAYQQPIPAPQNVGQGMPMQTPNGLPPIR